MTEPSKVSAQVTPSPTRKFNRDWISRSPEPADEELLARPDDEAAEDLYPRALWRCAVPCMGDDGDERACAFVAPVEEVMVCSVHRERRESPKSKGDSPSKTTKCSKGRAGFSPKAKQTSGGEVTPTSNTTNNDDYESLGNASPNTAPNTQPSPLGRLGIMAFLPSAPTKNPCAPLMNPVAAFGSRFHHLAPDDEAATVEYPEHEHHESHRTLHHFLKKSREDTLTLYIDDYQVSIFDRIVESLYGNSSLKTIAIIRSPEPKLGSQRTTAEMVCLFEAIRCLPKIHSLLISNARQDILPALAENLPSCLVKLNLHVLKGGVPNEFLDALATSENLTNVQLEAQQSMEIHRLVFSPSIRTLKISGVRYRLDPDHIYAFADAICCNLDSQLSVLDVQPLMDCDSWRHLALALRFNTSVKHLRVSFSSNSSHEQEVAAIELAELLQANSTLTHITNYTHDSLILSEDITNGIVLESLKSNMVLKRLNFFREDSVFWVAKDALLMRNLECFGKKGELGHSLYEHYVSFASSLPTIKANLPVCGHC